MHDAELAYALFADQSEALHQRATEHRNEALGLHFLLAPESMYKPARDSNEQGTRYIARKQPSAVGWRDKTSRFLRS